MLKNYLLISFRNLRKHLSYSLINIFGLSMGLATCLLLVTWITHELSYDRFHEQADQIYRPSLEMSFGGQEVKTPVSPTALLPALLDFPEVETGVRVYNPSAWNAFIVKKDDKLFQETHFYYADSTFFKIFSFKLLKGDPTKALVAPNSVILTTSTAEKYFGNEDPIGKTLIINNTTEYTVTGLMPDVPSNSFLQFDFLGSFSSLRQAQEKTSWWSANYQTFIRVHEKADIGALTSKTDNLVRKAVSNDLKGTSDVVHYNFLKLTDIHLRSPYDSEFEVVGDIQYVYIFSGVALLILFIACINYINLATARAIDRAKEVGIRKVVGAFRNQLFLQFLGESAMITGISFVVAFFTAQTLLPVFNTITDKNLSASSFYTPLFLSLSALILLIIALLSGAYPATAITSFKPVSVLKGNFKFSGKGVWLRKVLVITQFSISIILIVGTIVILKQLSFIQDKKLGFKKDNVMILPLDDRTAEVYSELKTEFIRSGYVSQIGRATESPTVVRGRYGFNLNENEEQGILTTAVAVDTGYIPSLGMEVVGGRNFNDGDFQRVKTDTFYAFIVNESLLKVLHLEPEQAVGTPANLSGKKGEIVGVVKDFHFSSLHSEIGPLVIFSHEDYNHIFLRLETANLTPALEKLKQISARVTPHRPFEYEFLDQQYAKLYSSEQRMGTIFTIFASLAIIIACLGLLGLVSFTAAQKTKEIGIRKVMGATVANIVVLITRDFSRLVLIAIVLSIPVSYWMMDLWLEDFAYKTTIGVWPIVIAALLSIVIAFAAAGYQAVKAALLDPAQTLRNE